MAQHTQPPPKPGVQDVTQAVIADLKDRTRLGVQKYGRPLQTQNGRNALQDAYEEALDLCQYLKQARMEQEEETVQKFRRVVVVSAIVCYGCGRLVHANESRPATVVMETGGDEYLAFYCRKACAGPGVVPTPVAQAPEPVEWPPLDWPTCSGCGKRYNPEWKSACAAGMCHGRPSGA